MHLVDIIFICFASVLTVVGIWRGLITEAFRLFSVIAGLAVAGMFYRQAYTALEFLNFSSSVTFVIAFVLVFVAAAAAVAALGWALKRVIHLTVLGWLDRLAGGIIGFLKSALIAWVLTLVIAALPAHTLQRTLERESIVYRTCLQLPFRLRIPGVRSARESIEKLIDHESISTLPNKLQQFKEQVDSAKQAR